MSAPPSAPPHEPRLARALRELLAARRTAALGTLDAQAPGQPFVSMTPFAIEPGSGRFVLHVSGLAAHTRNLMAHPAVSLMVMADETEGDPVHALPRVSFDGVAHLPERDSGEWQAPRAAYLARFPVAEPMTQLGDFRFVLVEPTAARQVAGFGAARSVGTDELAQILRR